VQVSCIKTRRALPAAITAVVALTCAAPAGASTVAPATAVLGAGDVAGLTLATTSAAPWTRLASGHATAGARASSSVLRSPGNPKLLIVSRALVARDSAHASAFKRALGRAGRSAANRVDARALGVEASALSKAQRIVWRDGPVVGEILAVGAAKGDGLVGRLEDIVRTRARRTMGQSAWAGLLARAGGARPGPATAQQAFALAVAPLPGVRVPRGPRGSIPDGTLATSWVLANYRRLTPSRRSAVDKIVRKAFALSVEGRAAAAQLNAIRDQAIAFAGRQAGVQLTLPVTIVRNYPSTGSGAATLGVDAGGSYRSAKPAARCIISVRRGGASKTVIAAQVFHCLQIQLAGRADALQTLDASRPWLGEGSAGYAGCLFAQDGAAAYRKAYATYVDEPATPLDHRTYDAIGFFAHLSTTGSGALASFADAMSAPSLAQAYPDVAREGAAGLFDTWASSLYRAPQRGAAWDVTGPCAPPRASAAEPTPIVLGNRSSVTITAAAYAAHPFELFADHSAASAIRVHRLSGHLRVASGGLDDQPQSDVTYCLSRSGRDDNPAIALSGGTGGAKATITAIDGGNACAPGGTATCRTQLCLVFGGNSLAPPANDPGIPLGPYDNPIPAENAKPGTPASIWNISGPGAQNMQGFTTNISYDQGETAQFKVKSNVGYRMDIYRLGWYGGDGARKVGAITGLPANLQTQAPCTLDTVGQYDCGGWSVTASWPIPIDAVSGVYFAHLIGTDGGESHIVFIVRNDRSRSDIYYQTSDTTWQAYNNYGENSLYTGEPLMGGGTPRAAKVSYNRPFVTRGVDSGQDWIFNAEVPMIRWLERNGYDVSYESGADTDRFGGLIRNHKVFMSSGHDEYWSGPQRANVTAARDAGVNLAFFSGNEVFWKTRWENNHRTLVSYKETHENAHIDPSGEWTGTWMDNRSINPEGPRPQNALTGTLFSVTSGTRAIQVPASYHNMPFWRDSGVGTALPEGTLGYEWDSDKNNGYRPPGLVDLSATTVTGTKDAPVQVLIDNGSTYDSLGTASHSLTLYRAPSGALVFGAGTVQWAWGLDTLHDRDPSEVSRPMQQATLNLFADMHVQPATRQSDLVPEAAVGNPLAPMP
jgi:hypothetical protein